MYLVKVVSLFIFLTWNLQHVPQDGVFEFTILGSDPNFGPNTDNKYGLHKL